MPDTPTPDTIFPVKNLLLTGNMNAGGFTITNLDLSGLNLDKTSVGLGNVDNTSDLAKPISTLTQAALDDKEDTITPGTTGQFYRGDKTFVAYGDLALQDGATTLPSLSSIALFATSRAVISAQRNDYGSSLVSTSIQHLGASLVGSVLVGLPGANVGLVSFDGAAYGVIRTDNLAPLVFGVNGIQRMRLFQGLAVGGVIDPGIGCISATGVISATNFTGGGSGITGLVKNQIPATLNATTFPSLTINGTAGNGFVTLSAQTATPTLSAPKLYANATGHLSWLDAAAGFPFTLAPGVLTAARTYALLNATGTLPVIVTAPTANNSPGVAGSEAYDGTYFYKCVATDTWGRVALTLSFP